jgi:2-iminobutanoate/2-iminopropanoate deaminase
MPVERIQPDGLSRPAAYTHVIRAGETVYIAGQTATDQNGQVVAGDIGAQATQVFENLRRAVGSVGGTLADLVKITVYVTDAAYRGSVGEARRRYLGEALPTSTFLVVAGLADPRYLVEIDAIAVVPAR